MNTLHAYSCVQSQRYFMSNLHAYMICVVHVTKAGIRSVGQMICDRTNFHPASKITFILLHYWIGKIVCVFVVQVALSSLSSGSCSWCYGAFLWSWLSTASVATPGKVQLSRLRCCLARTTAGWVAGCFWWLLAFGRLLPLLGYSSGVYNTVNKHECNGCDSRASLLWVVWWLSHLAFLWLLHIVWPFMLQMLVEWCAISRHCLSLHCIQLDC